MTVRLRPPRPGEAAALSALCLRSKAYWGYDRAFLAACQAELTLTEAELRTTPLRVATEGERVLGVAQLSFTEEGAHLEKLFVDPDAMGLGAGRALYRWALDEALAGGAAVLIVEADPDAAAFYEHLGARRAGRAPSGSIAGRELPRLRHELA